METKNITHGGWLGQAPTTTRLAFGQHRFYDSLAPEFGAYEAIRELARKKAVSGK